MNSQQRRLERYRVIYIWKILEKQVQNPGVEESISENKGRLVRIPPVKTKSSARVKPLREATLQVHGGQLFNLLSKHLRNLTKCLLEVFKDKLYNFLSTIPDEPKIGQLTPDCCNPTTAAPSNSLVDQIRLQGRTARS